MSSAPPLPILRARQSEPELESARLRTLRHFHLGDPSVERETLAIDCEHLPALLAPFRDASKIRYDYPLILFSRHSDPQQRYALPLSTFLQERLEEFAPGENSARILKDNLDRLEYLIRTALREHQQIEPLQPLLQQAAEQLHQQLQLSSDNHDALERDLTRLWEEVHPHDRLLPYNRYTTIHLLIHLVHRRSEERWNRFEQELQELRRQLQQLIDVEQHKESDHQADALQRSVGSNANRFKTDILSTLLPKRSATIQMSPERRARIERAAQTLSSYHRDPVQVRFVHGGDFDRGQDGLDDHFESIEAADPCQRATALFDEEAAELANLFAACRIARLELENHYDPGLHDPWFQHFGWEAFSEQELLLVPATVALESANRIATTGMSSFSRLLNSGRPIQILSRVRGHSNPAAAEGESPFHDYRMELGYLASAHRQCYVSQSSAARYHHLLSGFLEATEIPRTGVHLINTGIQDEVIFQETDPHLLSGDLLKARKQFLLDPWMVANAALEGRVHPFFRINPDRGDRYGERMDFSLNPQPQQDWVVHPFSYRDESSGEKVHTELAFTFADYALLIPQLRNHFRLIPDSLDSELLTPVADYLRQPAAARFSLIPYLWTVDEAETLHRVVISRELTLACLDRLNYWHTLQELAGIHNPHVDRAEQALRQRMEEEHEQVIHQLKGEHQAEMDELNRTATATTLSRLAQVLMGMELSGEPRPAAAVTTTATATAVSDQNLDESTAPPPATESTADESSAVETPALSEDPWIDSILCTSCNDCLNINPQLFVYNDDKQAYITDPTLGTYAQLVEAAEICPSRCIHPGSPLNPNEPDLEELIERAEPFNQ